MVMCWAPGCNHYNQRETCKFFKFPKEPQLRRKWISLVRRDIEPGPGACLCSCHFVDGKRENGPELFKHNLGKRFNFPSPEKRTRTTKKRKADVLEASTSSTLNKTLPEALAQASTSSQDPDVCSAETLTSSTLDKTLPEALAQASTSSQDPDVCSAETSTSSTLNTTLGGNAQPGTSAQDPDIFIPEIGESEELLGNNQMNPQPSTSHQQSGAFSSVLVEAENYFLEQALQEKEKEFAYLKSRMSFEHIKNNDSLILLYTGLPNANIFESILELLKGVKIQYYYKWNVEKLNRADQLLLTLMKLRQNFPQLDLAHRFNISQAAVSNIIITWVHVLHEALFKKLMAKIPDRKKNKSCLPNCFSTFTNCRIIIDCTEVYTVVPRTSMSEQKVTYSTYKHRNTWKGLIGVAPNGVITFISGLYPGSTSDQKIVQHCGLLTQLSAGDLILADKGFLIRDILPPGVTLNIPPFLTTAQFSPQQVHQTECIARARIHVERAIRRMKVFKILEFIPQTLRPYAEEVFQTIGALTNLQYPLVKEVEQYYCSELE